VLGWVGGVAKIDGVLPSAEAVRDRLGLITRAVDRLFDGSAELRASWTSLTSRRGDPQPGSSFSSTPPAIGTMFVRAVRSLRASVA